MLVNLGSGEDRIDEYLNIDIREEVDPDIICDIRDLPLKDSSVDYIYCKDVLEHFWRPEVVLDECSRILKDRGKIKVIVPDWHTLGDPQYWIGKDHRQLEKHIYGGHKNPHDQHHTIWTELGSERRFSESGFSDIEIEHLTERPLHWHLKITAQIKSQ